MVAACSVHISSATAIEMINTIIIVDTIVVVVTGIGVGDVTSTIAICILDGAKL